MSLTATARSIPGTLRQEVLIDGQHRLRFEIAIQLNGDLDEDQLERLDAVARACPLRRSIEAGIQFVERIERTDRAAGRQPAELGGTS